MGVHHDGATPLSGTSLGWYPMVMGAEPEKPEPMEAETPTVTADRLSVSW